MRPFLLTLFLAQAFYSCQSSSNSGSSNYEASVMTVEEQEKADPARFLNASGTYHENFWGSKTVIDGNIQNNATIASFKDVVVNVVYFSKTDTEIGREQYVIYDVFPARTKKGFKLKIKTPRATAKCGWEVTSATPL